MYIFNATAGLMMQTMLYLANQTATNNSVVLNATSTHRNDNHDVKCYGVYGCFPLNGPWTTINRQVNVHPQKPSEIEPHFILHNSRAFDKPITIDLNDPESVLHMNINPQGKIFFISHGYLETGHVNWMTELGKALLHAEPEGSASVVLIDWGGGSSPPYVQAVANIRLVGAITAHVIHMFAEELEMADLSQVHIIGHSLGAHLAGYAGYYLQRDFGYKLGRITGLDPAAPLFSETAAIVRLDRSDADFVDIIHTDANPLMKGGLGMHQRIGHVDYYPNGGFDNPGCDGNLQDYMRNKKNSILENMQEFLGCNHLRSYQYFTESVQTKCPFMGITCESYDLLKDGSCSHCGENGHFCMRMGYHSYEDYKELSYGGIIDPKKPPTLYSMTGEQKPFCRVHYKITVRVAGHDESTTHGGEIGTLSIRLNGLHKKTTERMRFSQNPMYFEPGFEYVALVPGKLLRNPSSATLFWEYNTNLLNPLTWRLASPKMYLEYILIESMESPELYIKLCPQDDSAIMTGSENILHPKNCKN